MSFADLLISLINFLLSKVILPLLPVNLPLFSVSDFYNSLSGSVGQMFSNMFVFLNNFIDVGFLLIIISVVIMGEILFWSFKSGMYLVKLVTGRG
jgi:hypothetical protein